ncbi:MAG TPA: hypothetical protein PKK66_01830 [Bacteroidales bacterium]|nr:hypothetical protein [Bacteroidales bacterium]HPT52648.1 hypothetical protein [Bacteroidales bacterium]
MKRITDIGVAAIIVGIVFAFAFIPAALQGFNTLTTEHGMLMSFGKFAILATFGEMLALRIRKGHYAEKGFGILPRMLVWGILGMGIAMSMMIFKAGTVQFLNYLGLEHAADWFAGNLSWGKLFVAFCVSVLMNSIFAPVFMTLHKITDIHIQETGGTLRGFFSRPIAFQNILANKINWNIQWGFIFKKTIPLFWYPAHTITFLLPGNYQVLFAAALGVVLGLILSIKK